MKTFRLRGETANWKNGLRMSAINLATLTEEESSTIPTNLYKSRFYVSVANCVYHVDDTRREIFKGEITDADKKSILAVLKNETPDYLLTLENKVVGYAIVRKRNGERLNEPAYDAETEQKLAIVCEKYAEEEITAAEYANSCEEIIADYIAKVVKPIDGAILLVAEIKPCESKKKETPKKIYRVVQRVTLEVSEEFDAENEYEACEKAHDLKEVVKNYVNEDLLHHWSDWKVSSHEIYAE